MKPKSDLMDLTNAATIDDLIRRCRELRADLEAAAVREAELRRALESIPKIHVLPLWQYRSQLETWWWHTRKDALANPSPLAEAAGAVVSAVDAIMAEVNTFADGVEGLTLTEANHIHDADARDKHYEALADAWEHHRALRDSMPLGYGTPETGADGGGSLTVPSDAGDAMPADASDDEDEPRIICDVCDESVVQDEHFTCPTCEVQMCLYCWQSESCPEHAGALSVPAPASDADADDPALGPIQHPAST